MTEAERHFQEEIRLGTERLKKEIGYNPIYFSRMVAEYGPVDASRRLIGSDAVSEGFTKLWEHGRLGMSVEALAVLPWYAGLFEPDLVAKALRRLEEYRFDVDGYLASSRVPSWWES